MKFLIVVDVQNDFVFDSLRNEEAIKRIPKIVKKIQQRDDENWKIIFTRDTHYGDYETTLEGKRLPIPHCIFNTKGWEIVPEVYAAPKKSCSLISKETFGALNLPNVINNLLEPNDSIEEIEVIGFVTSICVAANSIILRAAYPDVPISVDASCCAGLAKKDHDAALLTMRCQNIDITGEEI